MFKPGLFPPACFLKMMDFPFLSQYFFHRVTQILVNLILQPRLLMLRSLFLADAVLYIIPHCHCNSFFPFKTFPICIQNYFFLLLESIPLKLFASTSISSSKHVFFFIHLINARLSSNSFHQAEVEAQPQTAQLVQGRYPHPSFLTLCCPSKCHRNRLDGSLSSA